MINTVKQCTNNEENLYITSSQLVGSPMTSLFVNEIISMLYSEFNSILDIFSKC